MTIDPIMGGGSAERTFQMCKSLIKTGTECILMTTNIGLSRERLKALEGVNVKVLPILLKRFYIPRFSINKLENVIESVDIIHLMNHWTLLNALICKLAKKFEKPYVVCPAGSLSVYGRSKFLKTFYNWYIGREIINNAKGWVAVAKNEIPQFMSYGINADRITVIPNGIYPENYKEFDVIDFRKKYGLDESPFIMFLGRLNHIKGPDLLLEAFNAIKDIFEKYHLVFFGPDNGMQDELKRMVQHFNIERRVHFFGYIGNKDKSSAYHAADLVVIPSRQEAMSIVVLEAGITGTPVLLTDQCGFDIVSAIKGGMVTTATVDGLREGLINILRDPVRLKSMGEILYKYTLENFNWDVIINKYIDLYENILKKN
jgi:glycosyltransferase involved in cell wall biosynthesis